MNYEGLIEHENIILGGDKCQITLCWWGSCCGCSWFLGGKKYNFFLSYIKTEYFLFLSIQGWVRFKWKDNLQDINSRLLFKLYLVLVKLFGLRLVFGREMFDIWSLISRVAWYSNFRKYAKPPDEKRCIIMEKSFLCSLGIFFGACFA